MKKTITLLVVFVSLISFSQEVPYDKEYSYSEFLELIQQETDTVFRLQNALIKYDPQTDERFKTKLELGKPLYNPTEKIIVDKRVELSNVEFLARVVNSDYVSWIEGSLKDIHFKKEVSLNDVNSIHIYNCIFEKTFKIETYNCDPEGIDALESNYITITHSTFSNFQLFRNCFQSSDAKGYIVVSDNTFESFREKSRVSFGVYNSKTILINGNTFDVNGFVSFGFDSQELGFQIQGNRIHSYFTGIKFDKISTNVSIKDNTFSSNVGFYTDELDKKDDVDWHQFKGKLLSNSLYSYIMEKEEKLIFQMDSLELANLQKEYIDSTRYYNKGYFVNEITLKGLFYDYFKNRYDTETANEVYTELKDFETKRMLIRYEQNPGFKTYFTWKTNQFLKLFSAYGTEPARAIIFSLYVIVFFALIYLLFPNSWDTLGNRRLMSRFEFFQKYLRLKEGMHTIYLDGKKQEISSYEDFKANLENSKTELPSFFISWSKPLYNASMFSSKLTARFLQNTDVLKGKWQDLTPKQKRWKNIQIGFLLTIGLLYDLFIKVLNALMLSINTFTTLGFGEIPIKGLPRYLAIIQGFIGWFMLTIFSVSLISQLLN